jgi:aspartyl-tRNA(Asn)/glutamyl-tRNA(Gln) amidotransferase subunit B
MSYFPVIGLEIHVQLNTKTKLFCSCLNEYAPDTPNKNICPFCTGQPGALPVLNKSAVKKALMLGVALNSNIPKQTRWDRKNYFYPDLPAGYQISQYDNPIVEGGKLEFYVEDENGKDWHKKVVNLTRAHLEADAGKLLHVGEKSLVDYNRSGAPLVETVTEPELSTANEAMAFVSEFQLLVRTLGISDGDMDKGQMRFDCNISLRNEDEKQTGELPKYKVEIKNINSIRSLGRAIEYEIIRQTKLLDEGTLPAQETRGWKDDLNKTASQRSKEQAHDYRYFPEPDLQILIIKDQDKPKLENLPVLPMFRREGYVEDGLTIQTANTLVMYRSVGELYDQTTKAAVKNATIEKPFENKLKKVIANLISGSLLAQSVKLEKSIESLVSIENIITLAELFEARKISNQGLLKSIEILINSYDELAKDIIEKEGLLQLSDDTALEAFVDLVISNNPEPVNQYKEGKVQVIGFLVGQCMKESKGKGNPARFKELLEQRLLNL